MKLKKYKMFLIGIASMLLVSNVSYAREDKSVVEAAIEKVLKGEYSTLNEEEKEKITAIFKLFENSFKDSKKSSIVIGKDSTSEGINSVVIGNKITHKGNKNGMNNSVVIGNNLDVDGVHNIVVATDYENYDHKETKVFGEHNTVIGSGNLVGYKAKQNETDHTKWIYEKLNSSSDQNVVVGMNNTANEGSVVFGTSSEVEDGGFSFGSGNTVYGSNNKENKGGQHGLALGSFLKVKGENAIAIGRDSEAIGDWTISIGSGAKTKSYYSIAMGNNSEANGQFSVSIGASSESGYLATAIGGFGAKATANSSIALGSYSISSRNAGSVGYLANGLETMIWKSNLGAVSIGSDKYTRQIIGVAAGSEDTDAVNVAQLKELKNYVDHYSNPFEYYSKDKNQKAYKDKDGYYILNKGKREGIEKDDVIIRAKDNLQVGNVKSSIIESKSTPSPTPKPTPNVIPNDKNGHVVVAEDLSLLEGKINEKIDKKVDKSEFNTLKTEVNNNTKEIIKIKDDIKKIDEKSSFALSGVSNAIAMANLPQVMGDNKFNLSAAYGYYGGSHALAVGFSGTNEKQNFVYKLSGSVNNSGNLALGAGFGIMLGKINYTNKLEETVKKQNAEIQNLKEIVNKLMNK